MKRAIQDTEEAVRSASIIDDPSRLTMLKATSLENAVLHRGVDRIDALGSAHVRHI